MKIGLWSDCHNFPSLPLMKLSAYHKSLGDDTAMYSPLEEYDLVYASKTFSFTTDIDDEYEVRASELRRGGTGYCISVENGKEIFDENKNAPLPQEVEHIYPDYGLYPEMTFRMIIARIAVRRWTGRVVSRNEYKQWAFQSEIFESN